MREYLSNISGYNLRMSNLAYIGIYLSPTLITLRAFKSLFWDYLHPCTFSFVNKTCFAYQLSLRFQLKLKYHEDNITYGMDGCRYMQGVHL